MTSSTRLLRRAVILVPLVAVFWGIVFASSFWKSILSLALIWGILACGVNLLGGYGNMLSLGHAGIMGAAAYGVAVAGVNYQLGELAQICAGLAAGLVCSAIFGMISIRTIGVYFLLVTLALGMTVWGSALRLNSVTGGDNGIRGLARPALLDSVAGFGLSCLVVALLAVLATKRVTGSRFGLALRGLADSEKRLEAIGYNVLMLRFVAFMISGVFASVAGILFAYYNRFVSPDVATFAVSGKVVLMMILGGAGTLSGPFLGALIVTVVENYVSLYVTRWPTVLGAIYVAAVLFAPTGLVRLSHKTADRGRASASPTLSEASPP